MCLCESQQARDARRADISAQVQRLEKTEVQAKSQAGVVFSHSVFFCSIQVFS